MNETDELQDAIDTALAAGGNGSDVRDEVGNVAAIVSHGSQGAAAEWATRFNRTEREFDRAAEQGRAYTRGPSAVLARLVAQHRDQAAAYARALAEVAIAAASLGDLSISALGTATVLGNAQLVAAGMQPPSPADFAAGLVRAADPTPRGHTSGYTHARARASVRGRKRPLTDASSDVG